MVLSIPNKVVKLWNAWNLRVFVLSSFFLQILLMFIAPLSKQKKGKWVSMLLWVAYLLADWVAAYSIGLICNSKFQSSSSNKNDNLLMFWAPFLLLHLGGPDTITAFSLEDNELWVRHLLGLLFQVSITVYTLLQSPSNNQLLVPTVLIFITGLVKYGERTRAFYLACLDNFKESILRSSRSFLGIREGKNRFESVSNVGKEMTTTEIIQSGYLWFRTFSGVIVDHVFKWTEINISRDFFLKRDAKEVFRILEIELSFIYDFLYTKAFVVHSMVGYTFRFICSCFILISFFLFVFIEKHGYNKIDIQITYTLFIGAIIVDVTALLMLFVSDWTIVALKNSRTECIFSTILTKLPILNGPRWSESLPQYNLIRHCLNERPNLLNKMTKYLGLDRYRVEILFKYHEPVTKELKNFIFTELSKKYDGTKLEQQQIIAVISNRGEAVLKKNGWENVEYSIIDVEFDVSVLIWHIATEMCYSITEDPSGIPPKEKNVASEEQDFREFSKLLSNYMLYLRVMQPTLMSAVVGFGRNIYEKTYEHVKRYFFHEEYLEVSPYRASQSFFHTATLFPDYKIDPFQMESFLTDGNVLAEKLNVYENKWEIISKVWMEMLCYAASQCNSRNHAKQLNKGGELITFIWLMMAHLGLQNNSIKDSKKFV